MQSQTILQCTIGEKLYGVRLVQVEEVLELPMNMLTQVYCTHEVLLGMCSLRGQAIAILNSSVVLGSGSDIRRGSAAPTMMVLLSRFGEDLVGIPVDGIEDENVNLPEDRTVYGTEEPLLWGEGSVDGKALPILDLGKVLEYGLRLSQQE